MTIDGPSSHGALPAPPQTKAASSKQASLAPPQGGLTSSSTEGALQVPLPLAEAPPKPPPHALWKAIPPKRKRHDGSSSEEASRTPQTLTECAWPKAPPPVLWSVIQPKWMGHEGSSTNEALVEPPQRN